MLQLICNGGAEASFQHPSLTPLSLIGVVKRLTASPVPKPSNFAQTLADDRSKLVKLCRA